MVLIKKNKNYCINIRYVNYNIDDNGTYLNCDKHIITFNKYMELDNFFYVNNEKHMNFNFDGRRYIGVEDVRIFNDIENNELLFIGSGFHQNNQIGIVAGKYDAQLCTLFENELKTNFTNNLCEKNWVYVDYNNSTHIIYEWYPLKICKLNNKIITLVETKNMPKLFNIVRGSSCGFKYNNNEIWFVTHIVSCETPRHYYHVIVVFDNNMNLLRYSAPFKFEGEPIEYCLSIIVEDERVLINYSTWDRTTRIGVYDKKYIDSMIIYSNNQI